LHLTVRMPDGRLVCLWLIASWALLLAAAMNYADVMSGGDLFKKHGAYGALSRTSRAHYTVERCN
jgi:hypothetical protein